MSDDLPMGWSSVSIADIGEVVTGNTPPTKQRELFYGGNIPFVKPPDLDAGGFLASANETLSHEGSLQSRLLPPDSILVNCIGNIGKVAFSRVACCTNQQINSIVPNIQLVEPKFVYWSILSPIFQDRLQSNSSATTVSIINKGRFSALEIPLPPLNEQRRIVDKLERIGDRNRTARNELSHIPKLIARYKQAVLAAAFRGDLTADWREKHGKMRTQWQNVSLDNLISCYQNGLSKRSGNDGQEIIVVRLADIKDFKVCLSDPRKIKLTEKEEEKYNLQAGDILVVRVNGSKDIVGRLVLITQDLKAAYCDHFIRLRLTSECNPYWLSYYGNSDEFRKYISENMVSSAGQNTVSQGTLKDYLVEIPSLEEQKEIVRRVEKMFEKIDKMEEEYQKAAKLCDRLEQATLAKAFRGELVPQDPDDEPASVLLEQVKWEKVKGKKGKSI